MRALCRCEAAAMPLLPRLGWNGWHASHDVIPSATNHQKGARTCGPFVVVARQLCRFYRGRGGWVEWEVCCKFLSRTGFFDQSLRWA